MREEASARDFTGREWVFRRVDAWLANADPGPFLLVGPPGAGKTAIARQLVSLMSEDSNRTPNYGTLVYAHFCDAQDDSTLNPLRFIEQLALSIAAQHEPFASELTRIADERVSVQVNINIATIEAGATVRGLVIDSMHIEETSPRWAFDRVIRKPLETLRSLMPTLLVIVDGLDESLALHSDKHLADLLAHVSRDSEPLRWFVTSRAAEVRILDRLGAPSLDLITDNPVDSDDVRNYAVRRLTGMGEPRRGRIADRIADAADGNFLYARYMLDEIARNSGEFDESVALPSDLFDLYRQFLQREIAPDRADQRWRREYRPILGVVAAARGQGLSSQQVANIVGFPVSMTAAVLADCSQFLQGPQPDGPWRIYHRSFTEFLNTDRVFSVYPIEAHKRIGEHYLAAYAGNWDSCQDSYALEYLHVHLENALLWDQLFTLARDPRLFDAQSRYFDRAQSQPLATCRAALRHSVRSRDAVHMAEFAVRHARRQARLKGVSPLDVFDRTYMYGPQAANDWAWRASAYIAPLWILLLAAEMDSWGQVEMATPMWNDLVERPLTHLSGSYVDIAAVLLVSAHTYRPDIAKRLTSALLGEAGRGQLTLYLMESRQLGPAVDVAASIQSERLRLFYLNLTALSAEMGGDHDGALAIYKWVAGSQEEGDRQLRAAVPELADSRKPSSAILLQEVAPEVTFAQAMTGDLALLQRTVDDTMAWNSHIADSDPNLFVCHAHLGAALARVGDAPAAEESFGRASTLIESMADQPAKVWALMHLGASLMRAGAESEARATLARANEMAIMCLKVEDEEWRDGSASAAVQLGRQQAQLGDFDSAQALVPHLARADARSALNLLLAIAAAQGTIDPEATAGTLSNALSLARSIEEPTQRAVSLMRCANAFAAAAEVTTGEYWDVESDARKLIDSMLLSSSAELHLDPAVEAEAFARLSRVLEERGSPEAAEQALSHALSQIRASDPSARERLLAGMVRVLANDDAVDVAGTLLKEIKSAYLRREAEEDIAAATSRARLERIARGGESDSQVAAIESPMDRLEVECAITSRFRRRGADEDARTWAARAESIFREVHASVMERYKGREGAETHWQNARDLRRMAFAMAESGALSEAETVWSESVSAEFKAREAWSSFRLWFGSAAKATEWDVADDEPMLRHHIEGHAQFCGALARGGDPIAHDRLRELLADVGTIVNGQQRSVAAAAVGAAAAGIDAEDVLGQALDLIAAQRGRHLAQIAENAVDQSRAGSIEATPFPSAFDTLMEPIAESLHAAVVVSVLIAKCAPSASLKIFQILTQLLGTDDV
jgi:hypothetical protein